MKSEHALCTPVINSKIINVHPLIVSNIDWCVLKHSLIGLLRHHGNMASEYVNSYCIDTEPRDCVAVLFTFHPPLYSTAKGLLHNMRIDIPRAFPLVMENDEIIWQYIQA